MFSKIYLDTAPLIYFLENHPRYALKVQDILQGNSSDGCKFATSVITNVEYLPKPMRENKQDLVFAYNALKSILNMEVISVIEDISMEAVKIRIKYPGIKALDSIHLASAVHSGCDAFLTNDEQLKQVSEIQILYLEEM